MHTVQCTRWPVYPSVLAAHLFCSSIVCIGLSKQKKAATLIPNINFHCHLNFLHLCYVQHVDVRIYAGIYAYSRGALIWFLSSLFHCILAVPHAKTYTTFHYPQTTEIAFQSIYWALKHRMHRNGQSIHACSPRRRVRPIWRNCMRRQPFKFRTQKRHTTCQYVHLSLASVDTASNSILMRKLKRAWWVVVMMSESGPLARRRMNGLDLNDSALRVHWPLF